MQQINIKLDRCEIKPLLNFYNLDDEKKVRFSLFCKQLMNRVFPHGNHAYVERFARKYTEEGTLGRSLNECNQNEIATIKSNNTRPRHHTSSGNSSSRNSSSSSISSSICSGSRSNSSNIKSIPKILQSSVNYKTASCSPPYASTITSTSSSISSTDPRRITSAVIIQRLRIQHSRRGVGIGRLNTKGTDKKSTSESTANTNKTENETRKQKLMKLFSDRYYNSSYIQDHPARRGAAIPRTTSNKRRSTAPRTSIGYLSASIKDCNKPRRPSTARQATAGVSRRCNNSSSRGSRCSDASTSNRSATTTKYGRVRIFKDSRSPIK